MSIPSDLVSRHHAELYWDGERLRIRDLGSRNGTAVNGNPVVDWVDLRDGDVIVLGNVQCVIQLGGAVPVGRPIRSQPTTTTSERPTLPHRPPTRLSNVPIFISHSSEDKVAARSIATYLRSARWKVWIDEVGIAGGKDWRQELVRALEQTWVVVLLISLYSMRSKWRHPGIEAARLGSANRSFQWSWMRHRIRARSPHHSGRRPADPNRPAGRRGSRRGQQLAQLDHALVLAARQRVQTPPGKTLIFVGNIIRVVGVIGLLFGFGLFVYLGFGAVNEKQRLPFCRQSTFLLSATGAPRVRSSDLVSS